VNGWYLLNNSGKLDDSWHMRFLVVGYINFKSQKLSLIRKIPYQLAWDTTRFLPSVEMTASFVIPNECEESRFMLKIS